MRFIVGAEDSTLLSELSVREYQGDTDFYSTNCSMKQRAPTYASCHPAVIHLSADAGTFFTFQRGFEIARNKGVL
jgi:hypothetical protein